MKGPSGVLAVASTIVAIAAAAAQEPVYKNSIGMELVLINPGTMQVGVFQPECPSPDASRSGRGRSADPRTVWTEPDYVKCMELAKQDSSAGFTVTIAQPYYIGKYEVTQAQWTHVMGTNPSIFQGAKVRDDPDNHPVDHVRWEDAQAFVQKLNALENTQAYRLPTEFEWEYAARAGGPGQTGWTEIRELAWEQDVNKGTTHAVGTKKPNAWGLYDMLGNVWEWVQDYYNDKLFADPVPPATGKEHVLKGGSFLSDVKNTIYATHGAGPGSGFDVGFRIVRDTRSRVD